MRTRNVVLGQTLLSLTLVFSSRVSAETTGCTALPFVPVVIDTPGIYCLQTDLEHTQPMTVAIRINSNDVVLDLNGHTLRGTGGAGTMAYGIYAGQRRNVTVRNGTVAGFAWGIALSDQPPYTTALGYLVEGIRAEQNTMHGIWVAGRSGIVRNNHVVATGGSTQSLNAFGISLCGSGHRAMGNDVMTVTKQGAGISYGISFCSVTTGAMAVGNRINEADRGIFVSVGAAVKNRDNLTMNVAIPYVLGTDAGNNN